MHKTRWYGGSFCPAFVKYCLCLTPEQYEQECKKLNMRFPRDFLTRGCTGTTHFWDGDDGTTVAIVCIDLDKERNINELKALIVHEAVHVFQEMMLQQREENPGKEIQAFHIQRISLDLMTELDDYLKEHPHAHPDYSKQRKKRRNVVRGRR